MKYVIIIPDGAADLPLPELDDRTPFEAAKKPFTDRLSIEGRQGTVVTTPPDLACGSDVCSMSLLGYDPMEFHRGRAPLEAAALGLELQPYDWVFRVNLVTVVEGCMQDHSAGHISSEEASTLLTDLAERVELPGMTLYPGVSYRNILVDRPTTEAASSGKPSDGRDWAELVTTPPHDIPGQSIRKFLPEGSAHVDLLQQLIAQSEVLFADHEINQTRRELGELPATHVWPWGQGQPPIMPSFEKMFGLQGAMITAVDLLAGIAAMIGWDRINVPGQTSYHDTDYAAAGRGAIEAIEKYDIVCVHVEAPDEASHAGDAATKVQSIEAIDQHIVGPVLSHLKLRDEPWRMLYLPDHYTCVQSRKHDPTPVPFALAGQQIRSVLKQPFCEANANRSDLHVAFGHELMEYFLLSGLST